MKYFFVNVYRLFRTFLPNQIRLFRAPLFIPSLSIKDDLLFELEKYIEHHKKMCEPEVFSNGSDKRWYNVKKDSFGLFDSILKSSGLINIINLEHSNLVYFIMYNEIDFNSSNTGSGGGLHLDSTYFQRKLIFYLSDTNEETGCFYYYPQSYSLWYLRKYILMNIFRSDLLRVRHTPNSFTQVRCPGIKGSGFYVVTSVFHSGLKLQKGSRRAITYYMFEKDNLPEQFKNYVE